MNSLFLKHSILMLSFLFSVGFAFSQAPEKLSYQSVIRRTNNDLVVNQNVRVKISILKGTIAGTAVYVEEHSTSTNSNGLVSLSIGGGNNISGSFSAINWENGPYFVKMEADPTGGTNYTVSGTSQLLSVPYALYAKTSGSSTPGPQGIQGVQGVAGINGTNGTNGTNGVDGKNTLVKTTTEAAGANCATGGVKLEYGIDANNNGVLDLSEKNASLTKYVCNGATGPTGVPGSSNGAFTHWIGKEYGGGIVFCVYRDQSGIEHGLVVAKQDAGFSDNWGVNSYVADANSLYDGFANTQAIINAGATPGSAAEMSYNYESEGYNDWYLPSQGEIQMLFSHEFEVNRALYLSGGVPLNTDQSTYQKYHTSTQQNSSRAYEYDIYYGNAHISMPKSSSYQSHVRPIRSY